MPLNPEILAQRIAELNQAFRRQMEKAGQPGYDPALTDLLKKDLDWLNNQQGQDAPVPSEKKD
ncbi:MAG: hypothetical protein Q8939_05140 [Bacteroidota bacterium]|nr:hypothetical protein [Bacteroidota bacterium]